MSAPLIADKRLEQSAAFIRASQERDRDLLVTALREITGSPDFNAVVIAKQALLAVGEA